MKLFMKWPEPDPLSIPEWCHDYDYSGPHHAPVFSGAYVPKAYAGRARYTKIVPSRRLTPELVIIVTEALNNLMNKINK